MTRAYEQANRMDHPFYTQLQKEKFLFYAMILQEKGGFKS